jgi:hypothetical protein
MNDPIAALMYRVKALSPNNRVKKRKRPQIRASSF